MESVVEDTINFVNGFSDYEGVETELDEFDVNPSSIAEEVQRILAEGCHAGDNATSEISNLSGDVIDSEIDNVMSEMEKELRGTTLNQSFHRTKDKNLIESDSNGSSDDEDTSQLDIDVNLVNNFLQSISSQDNMTGPVSNLLLTMGISSSLGDNTS